jgi:predicted ester cyclase
MTERNKAAARAVFEVWSGADPGRLDELVARDVEHHDPYDPNAAAGLEGMKETIARTRQAYPDLVLTVDDQLAEADKVATRWTATMTDGGRAADNVAMPRRLEIAGITIDRFAGGKIVEAWRSMDRLRLLRDSGALDSTGSSTPPPNGSEA